MPALPEQVWEALTDPERMTGWFGGRMDWEMEEGADLQFAGDDGSRRSGRIEEIRTGRLLRFVWWREGDGCEADASEVSYLIEPAGDATRLTVQEKPATEVKPWAPASAQACWTPWDSRLAGAWIGMSAGAVSRAGV